MSLKCALPALLAVVVLVLQGCFGGDDNDTSVTGDSSSFECEATTCTLSFSKSFTKAGQTVSISGTAGYAFTIDENTCSFTAVVDSGTFTVEIGSFSQEFSPIGLAVSVVDDVASIELEKGVMTGTLRIAKVSEGCCFQEWKASMEVEASAYVTSVSTGETDLVSFTIDAAPCN